MGIVSKLLLVITASALFFSTASAEMGIEHKVVIQVSTADVKTQTIALNNAVNIQKHFEPGEVKVEIVAYGPGLSLLTEKGKNKLAKRVASLAMSDITFSACDNTMKKIEKKSGKKPVLIDGVKVVPAGVVRIMRLQEKGYSYIRP
ncbi:MAG: DsrE family protein [Gammaproteobacteria bacterium]|nr:DsrE family protein [Gammaproteobacteria bacterium]MCW8986592.1 DsrE family protein [Gammaproteobacteria bacterium]MCW9029952.1 DsrE family protein [Gammaproteobacteria bacterium]